MSNEREQRYLTYIHDSIHRVEQRTAGGREASLEDDVLQDAVIWQLETLADATHHLSNELRERHPEITWREITNFRNLVAHGYLEVDLQLVWDVIEADLPSLKTVVEQELRKREQQLEQ